MLGRERRTADVARLSLGRRTHSVTLSCSQQPTTSVPAVIASSSLLSALPIGPTQTPANPHTGSASPPLQPSSALFSNSRNLAVQHTFSKPLSNPMLPQHV